ncbi:MAG TPA: hypothetical protein VLH94_02360 [Spirochaetia bacterium]|nr:hypothetical protein [Spirochaetia bacterium]
MKLLVFTYAPAGLGHLRVTDALVDSKPKKYPYIMLGSYDRFITSVHRFFSTNLIGKWIFTSFQYGIMEDIGTAVYRWILVVSSRDIYLHLKQILDERSDVDEVWVVATHFGMAHQIGAVKERLMKETGKIVKLVVQVTDDTSQHIWCIRGADLTFVPSHITKNKLESYAKWKKMDLLFEVIPYPICPALTKKLSDSSLRSKAFLSSNKQINISVPISGAAVGLSFVSKLISLVTKKSSRFKFWVLAKKSVYTDMFLSTLSKLPNVKLVTGRNDNEMISLYELMYQDNLMHMEITKPSEQAFKAILPPNLVGGSILLFSSPVGRQEYENIDFLERQGLMPRSNYSGKVNKDFLDSVPRAVRLSNDPKIAADFILWGLKSGLFSKMSSSKYKFTDSTLSSGEVGSEGANEFWKKTIRYFG